MTAEEARTFERLSAQSYLAVKRALEERGCQQCEPYEDVFTLPRWNAQGYLVRQGEKAVRVAVWLEVEPTEAELEAAAAAGQEPPAPRLRPWTAHVFCRCQVYPKPELARREAQPAAALA